jgi:DNA (cytosine-5)-methyltransferase 1
MYTFVELAARKRPKWVVWENVPGVLSSNKGGDFASFLGLLTGRDIQAPVGGWANSGCIEGISSAYGVAWTMLDAQDFGVAQRRKRIFVVGYLGDWRAAAAVLFERNRLSGNTAKSRQERKATSSDAQGCSRGGSQSGIATFAGNVESDVAATLQTSCDDYSRADGFNVVAQTFSAPAIGNIVEDNISGCITKNSGGGGETQNPAFVLEPKPHAFKVRGGSEDNTGEQGGTPGKKAGKGYLGQDEKVFTIGTTQDQQIMQPLAFDTFNQTTSNVNQTIKSPQGGLNESIGVIAQPIAVDCYNFTTNENTTQTIRSQNDKEHIGAVLQPVPYRKSRRAQSKDDHETWVEDEKTNTLNSFDTGDVRTTQAIVQPNISPTITQCKGSRGGSSMEALDEVSAIHAQQPTMAIRRLTPRECERLQGFPDDWTLIPYRKKPAEQCPDGPRYKACGNSMAVPCMAYLGRRIQMVEDLLKEH